MESKKEFADDENKGENEKKLSNERDDWLENKTYIGIISSDIITEATEKFDKELKTRSFDDMSGRKVFCDFV